MKVGLAAALAAALALPAATPATSSGWSQPIVIAPAYAGCVPAKCSTFPQLATNARGDALASFRHYFDFRMSRPSGLECQYSTKSRFEGWLPPERFPQGVCPVVALDFGANAMAVWTELRGDRHVVLAQLHESYTGRWIRGQQLSPASADAGDVAVASGGAIVAAWSIENEKTTSVQTAVRTSGRFGPARTLWKTAGSLLIDIEIAVNADGDAIVAWSTVERGRSVALVASRIGGRWQTAQTLAQPRTGYASTPAVAIDDRGNAVALWSESGGSEAGLHTAFQPAGDRFGAKQRLSASGFGPEVAFDADGNALATWQEERSGLTVAVATFRRNGRWRRPDRVSAPRTRVGSVTSAVAPSGEAIVVWLRHEFGSAGVSRTIQAAVGKPGSAFGPPQEISETGLLAGRVDVALDVRGNGIVLWEGADGAVEAATFTR